MKKTTEVFVIKAAPASVAPVGDGEVAVIRSEGEPVLVADGNGGTSVVYPTNTP
jgi:hypothetical protein